MRHSKSEKRFLRGWHLFGDKAFPDPAPEYYFDRPRTKRRFDFAWPALRVVVDIQGGTYARKRTKHSRGSGQSKDFDKANAATLMGYKVLIFDTAQLSGRKLRLAIDTVNSLLQEASYASTPSSGR